MSVSISGSIEHNVMSQEASASDFRTRQGPSANDWERVKSVIKGLYLDQGHSLKDVMRIMAENHNHRAT
jgi:CBS domain-containing protein